MGVDRFHNLQQLAAMEKTVGKSTDFELDHCEENGMLRECIIGKEYKDLSEKEDETPKGYGFLKVKEYQGNTRIINVH